MPSNFSILANILFSLSALNDQTRVEHVDSALAPQAEQQRSHWPAVTVDDINDYVRPSYGVSKQIVKPFTDPVVN